MKNNNEQVQEKMTLKDYEKKYTRRQNIKAIKSFLLILEVAIGLIIAACLFYLVLQIYNLNNIAGYVSIAFAVVLYIFLYIVPVIKIKKTKSFTTNVNANNAKDAKKHNKKMREEIADKMIEFTATTEGIGWYRSDLIGKLAIARQTKNDEELKNILTELYNTDVKKTANSIIREHAVRVGITTAISQSEKLDSMFVAIYEINLIKDLVFLYGYRPSEAQLLKIYTNVIHNALIAYGVQGVTQGLATGVAQKIGQSAKGIPLLGNAIATVIDSASQGVVNGSLTVVIGIQTKKYLMKEYKLQNLLDGLDVSEDNEAEMIKEVKEDILKETK